MTEPDRLRQHPQDRFAPSVQRFDLSDSARTLRAEEHPAVEGHRQLALDRHGPVTMLLFVFEAGGVLREHSTPGFVVIHALAGVLRVGAEGSEHTLAAGQLVTLAPDVVHSVEALEAAEALVTVHKLDE